MTAESQAPSYPPAMGIDHNSRNFKGMPQYDVRRLAPDAGETRQLGHRGGHAAAEFFDQLPRAALQRLCFGAKESKRADQFFDLAGIRLRQLRGVWVTAKECRGDSIDSFVGALRR